MHFSQYLYSDNRAWFEERLTLYKKPPVGEG